MTRGRFTYAPHPALGRTVLTALLCLMCLGSLCAAPAQAVERLDVEQTVRALAFLEDRSTGTAGAELAAELIERALETAFSGGMAHHEKVQTGRQSFTVPVQLHEGSSILLPEEPLAVPHALHPLRMNALATGTIRPEGLTGRALYAGSGALREFNGMDVAGAVVLMDLASGKNWINAAMLGAGAVIFIDGSNENDAPQRYLFNNKSEQTPIAFPRFWMSVAQAEEIFGPLEILNDRRPLVELHSRTTWTNTTAQNVWAFIPGTDPTSYGEYMLVQAFYDSTAFVPGRSPGADEAVSVASLLHLAQSLAATPPKRSVLLLASSGHAQSVAGSRALTWTLTGSDKEFKQLQQRFIERRDDAQRTLAVLDLPDPLAVSESQEAVNSGDAERLRTALHATVKTVMDQLTTELMRLRLAAQSERDSARIAELSKRRLTLRNLVWVATPQHNPSTMDATERATLQPMLGQTRRTQAAILEDAIQQLGVAESNITLRQTLDGMTMRAGFSLHLSSHGDGIGAFERGWLYDLNDSVNRTRFFAPIGDAIAAGAKQLGKNGSLWQATLRPDRNHPWQSYLPDKPALASEPLALAGLPMASLATLNDLRADWGTPNDIPARVNFAYARRQAESVVAMIRHLDTVPLPPANAPQSGFAILEGRANLQRQGELFPDQPAQGTVVLTFLGKQPFYSMVDTAGTFRTVGLANRNFTVHKAIIEAFRFDQDTGLAVWAVDKPKVGKDNYRVKLGRRITKTDLVLFGCTQTTLFNMLEPRTLDYLYRSEIIDARSESQPLRYWYSRMDTRSSTLATLFLEPDVPFKLTLSDTVLGKKMLLLNTSTTSPMGKGFPVSKWPTVPLTEFRAATDMWNLLTPRIGNLEEHGIINDRIRSLHSKGEAAMRKADEALRDKRWDDMFEASRSALAYASLVYNDVDTTQRDVLTGVLFYIALFVPFAYCLERLLIGAVTIHRRIIGFCGVLLATIGVIYAVHPAFQLTYSPGVVILAFFIMGLSTLVSLIIFFRFEREMVELQRRSLHLKSSEISKWAAFAAAMVIGVSNLRRRPVRTALTIATLVILTFTIMNFTAAKSIRKEGWVSFRNDASYHGLMIKKLRWATLPPETMQVMEDMLGSPEQAAPRVWYETSEQTSPPVIPLHSGGKDTVARAMIGLPPHEGTITRIPQGLMAGEWLRPEDRFAVILPETIAARLDVRMPESPDAAPPAVTIWGQQFTVRGIIRDAALEEHPDLDGEMITPIFYPNESASRLSEVEAEAIAEGEDILRYDSRYVHVNSKDTIIVPAPSLLAAGGSLKSVAFRLGEGGIVPHGPMAGHPSHTLHTPRMHAPVNGRTPSPMVENGAESMAGTPDMTSGMMHVAGELGDRLGTMLFRGDGRGTALFFASNATSYAGISNILIPLAISVLIVLNTMIGSVHERRGEIGVYTSIGLAPSHVSFLFVAEALAFAVISVVFGYLVAQGAAALFAGTPLWEGMTANYSSTAGVAAMLIVISVVLISVIYPSKIASRIAIPDVSRSWKLPEPEGDKIILALPFLIKTAEQACAGGYLMDYYNAHADISHGDFSTENLACTFIPPEDLPGHGIHAKSGQELIHEDVCFLMDLKAWLAPFDFGVRQTVKLVFCPSDTYAGFKQIQVILTREAGEKMIWRNLNKRFLDGLRKQLLVWRSLDDEARQLYEAELATIIGDAVNASVMTDVPAADGLHEHTLRAQNNDADGPDHKEDVA
ncbi:M28 family peptidase [Desulfovibrio mangrovi]|uniref:FtsX-like permease family protein n=1 Tax=Desulfovibrio mangrovi TaxID=2976983 RepID=UPI002246F793|nr:FtsX-like permease family protein [Desulfovibrio mangrovi]UZP66637.1 M28 family peptidase [Desulfovibrio mangrovi]